MLRSVYLKRIFNKIPVIIIIIVLLVLIYVYNNRYDSLNVLPSEFNKHTSNEEYENEIRKSDAIIYRYSGQNDTIIYTLNQTPCYNICMYRFDSLGSDTSINNVLKYADLNECMEQEITKQRYDYLIKLIKKAKDNRYMFASSELLLIHNRVLLGIGINGNTYDYTKQYVENGYIFYTKDNRYNGNEIRDKNYIYIHKIIRDLILNSNMTFEDSSYEKASLVKSWEDDNF